jgi:hypothetical protein
MKASETTLERDEIVTESGRVFRRHNQEFLDNLPPDIVQEMARRRLEETQAIKAKRAPIPRLQRQEAELQGGVTN